MKNLYSITTIVLFVSIPAFLAYLSSSDSILDYWKDQKYLGDNFNVELFKQYFLILGIILTSGYLSINNELTKRKHSVILSQRTALINQLRISTLYYLENILQDEHVSSIKFRVWSERKDIFYVISRKLYNIFNKDSAIFFYERQIEGLTDMINPGLCFEVKPNIQGVVGLCYNEKEIKYEEDLSLSLDSYNLSSFQLSQARSTKFCLCSPIFNTDNEIVSIISFESIHYIKVNLDNEYSLANAITNFCQSLYQNCPELFK